MDDLPQGSQQHDLETFRRIYLDSAFTCCYRDCPRYADGFQSSVQLNEHEKHHAKPLRCADPSCEFFERGFNSRTGLLKHNRKYHPTPDEIELPKFEPAKEQMPQDIMTYPSPQLQPLIPDRVVASLTPPPQPEQDKQLPQPTKRARVSRAKRGLKVHACDLCDKVCLYQ